MSREWLKEGKGRDLLQLSTALLAASALCQLQLVPLEIPFPFTAQKTRPEVWYGVVKVVASGPWCDHVSLPSATIADAKTGCAGGSKRKTVKIWQPEKLTPRKPDNLTQQAPSPVPSTAPTSSGTPLSPPRAVRGGLLHAGVPEPHSRPTETGLCSPPTPPGVSSLDLLQKAPAAAGTAQVFRRPGCPAASGAAAAAAGTAALRDPRPSDVLLKSIKVRRL